MSFFRFVDDTFNLHHSRDEVVRPEDFAMHTHTNLELYYFISGGGIFHIEGNSYTMQSGDILLMRPAESHYIEVDSSPPYERIVLGFPANLFDAIDPERRLTLPFFARKSGQKNMYQATDFKDKSYQNLIYGMTRNDVSDMRINILSHLIMLLNEIGQIFDAMPETGNFRPDTVEYRIVRYINNNLSEDLTLDHICKRFFISKSQLSRIFKKATGTTVWEYITVKRLMLANQLLNNGERATNVCLTCGFSDYSTFYRAYTRHFGYSPGNTPKD